MTPEAPAPTGGLPLHVSHSQLSSWSDRCQKAFFLERIAKAPKTPAFWFIGGSAVHEVTEELDRRALEFGLTPSDLNVTMDLEDLFLVKFDQLLREEEEKSGVPSTDWLAAGFRPKQDATYWKTNGPTMISNYLSWRERVGWEIEKFYDHNATPIPGIELKLNLTLDLNGTETEVLGAPDRVFVLPNGELVIVDIKSGSTTPATQLQQGLYACMIEDAYGVRPKYGTFVKVGTSKAAGGIHTALTHLKKFDRRYYEQLFSAYRAQAETGLFLPSVSDMCDRCPVAGSCYAAGGSLSHKYDPLDPNYGGNHGG